MDSAIDGIISGNIKGLITLGVNPVFTMANGKALGEAKKNLDEFRINNLRAVTLDKEGSSFS